MKMKKQRLALLLAAVMVLSLTGGKETLKKVAQKVTGHSEEVQEEDTTYLLYTSIQSVDSEHLLLAIEKEAAKAGIVQDILLEVNIGGEESKTGTCLLYTSRCV